ncbi:MAG: 50S ribosomal protein L17 [Candidatus Berkelbacteria bacterium]|nr:50S ribosomal protein L17 [Candidatus Berkelbacteria bacterium]
MRQFSRKTDHRNHLIRNLATSLVLYERIDTTLAKGKEVKSFLDALIARAKDADLNAIRQLKAVLFDMNAVKKIIEELVPRYAGRNSGFTRSYHLKNRLGDNSAMMRLELVDRKVFVAKEEEPKAKTKTASKALDIVSNEVNTQPKEKKNVRK